VGKTGLLIEGSKKGAEKIMAGGVKKGAK